MTLFKLMQEYLISKGFEDHGFYGTSILEGAEPKAFSVRATSNHDIIYINSRDDMARMVVNGKASEIVDIKNPNSLIIFDKFLNENVSK